MRIIGITGTFGSGCTFIAKSYIENAGYAYISLSDILRNEYSSQYPDNSQPNRQTLQDYGNELRMSKSPDILAQIAIKEMAVEKNYVVDSIRNTNEILALRSRYGDFFLLGINADQDIRWDRVKDIYDDDKKKFEIDEERDKEEEFNNGQQVSKCFERADYVIINNETIHGINQPHKLMKQEVERFLQLVNREGALSPNIDETAMVMAHAVAHRSTCCQRSVGAVIVDSEGSVFASGYNVVPKQSDTCQDFVGQCYRKYLREQFKTKISTIISDSNIVDAVYKEFKQRVKMLDYCRALHAEENAILSIARNGSSSAIPNATLYTTTYPCNLCANKIASIGIMKVVFSAPYPMADAKDTLRKSGVCTEAFHGITFTGYFKMEGVFK